MALVVLGVNAPVEGLVAVHGGVPCEEDGVVDRYRAHHLENKPRQRRG